MAFCRMGPHACIEGACVLMVVLPSTWMRALCPSLSYLPLSLSLFVSLSLSINIYIYLLLISYLSVSLSVYLSTLSNIFLLMYMRSSLHGA